MTSPDDISELSLEITLRLRKKSNIGEENATDLRRLREKGPFRKTPQRTFDAAIERLRELGVIALKGAKVWLHPWGWEKL